MATMIRTSGMTRSTTFLKLSSSLPERAKRPVMRSLADIAARLPDLRASRNPLRLKVAFPTYSIEQHILTSQPSLHTWRPHRQHTSPSAKYEPLYPAMHALPSFDCQHDSIKCGCTHELRSASSPIGQTRLDERLVANQRVRHEVIAWMNTRKFSIIDRGSGIE